MRRHASAPLDFLAVQLARALGEISLGAPHLADRPRQVHRRGTGGQQRCRRVFEVLPTRRRERVAVRRGDPDCGGSADGQRADRLRDVGGRAALELDLLVRKPALVEEDDAVALQPNDLVRG